MSKQDLTMDELDHVSGGLIHEGKHAALDGASIGTLVMEKRTKSADRQQAAVMAFIKG